MLLLMVNDEKENEKHYNKYWNMERNYLSSTDVETILKAFACFHYAANAFYTTIDHMTLSAVIIFSSNILIQSFEQIMNILMMSWSIFSEKK